MSATKLTAEIRENAGKGVARKLRAGGRIPAVLYGQGRETTELTLKTDEVDRLLSRANIRTHVLELEVAEGGGSSKTNVLIKEVQTHPYRDSILHLDLLEVSMTEKVHIKVPLVVTGDSPGVKLGGILELKRRELEVFCLPDRIPDSLVVDISRLEIGDSLHVMDIQPPEGVTIPHDVNFTLLTVVGAAMEEEKPAEEAAEEEAPTEPELIRKGKVEEETE